jgi:hypothetical protein
MDPTYPNFEVAVVDHLMIKGSAEQRAVSYYNASETSGIIQNVSSDKSNIYSNGENLVFV